MHTGPTRTKTHHMHRDVGMHSYHATVLTVLQMMKKGAVKIDAVSTMFQTQLTPSSDMYIDVDTYPAIPHVKA